MKKIDISHLPIIGYKKNFFGVDMQLHEIFRKNGGCVYAVWSEYTGYGYKPHISKVYNLTESPYIIHAYHNGKYRVHIEDFQKVQIENGYMILCGESVNIWDFLE